MTAVSLNSNPMVREWARPPALAGQCGRGSCVTTQEAQSAAQPIEAQQAQLESAWATLRRSLTSAVDAGRWLDGESNAVAVGLHAVSKQRAGIEIRTQEGDIVRIKLSSRVAVNASAAQTTSDGKVVSALALSVSQTDRLRVSVQGDLNDAELAAIDAALSKIDALADEFFAGNLDSAFAQAAALDIDDEQLANVAVQLSQRTRVAMVASSVAAAAEPAPLPQAPAEPPSAGQSGAAATEAIKPAVAADAPAETHAPSEPEPQALPATAAASSTASITQSIAQFVVKLTWTLRATERDVQLGMSFRSKLSILLESIKVKQPDPYQQLDPALAKLENVANKAAVATATT